MIQRMVLPAAILVTLLGIVILIFAGGLRRYYSGLFFVVLGLVTIWRDLRQRRAGGAD